MTYRLFVLSTHYRNSIDFSLESLGQTSKNLKRLNKTALNLKEISKVFKNLNKNELK